MMSGKTLLCAVLFCLLPCAAYAGTDAAPPITLQSWRATDGLGRTLPSAQEVGPSHSDRFVGIFYFLWLNEIHNRCPDGGPYDVSKILAKDPDALKKPHSPLWRSFGGFHYWGEPLYGYYLTTDPWVLRRHAYLLADAGIDVLIFDTTNAITYPEQYTRLCEVYEQIRKEGGRTPHIAFMVHTLAGKTAAKLYNDLYKPGLFRNLWFIWKGKPLLICDPAEASPEMRQFFTLRAAHWPFTLVNTHNEWHWETTYPQAYSYDDDPAKPEQVNVAVAQNLRVADGKVTNMSRFDARGRSFHDGKMDTSPGSVNKGFNFQEQWKRVFDLQPPFVMVTGWNEWIAGRWGKPDGPIEFVDQFSEEYSRDIEPMKGGHADNYYLQLIANVRRYKGAVPLPKASPAKSIRLAGKFDQWQSVQPVFHDHVGETMPRDFDGAGGLHYTNRTGRNDIELCKVARDKQNVYFYVRTREPIVRGDNWMWLLIDADSDPATGWEGYDFIVNRSILSDDTTWLEKNAGSFTWQHAAKVSYRVKGNELELAIPRSALGLPDNSTAAAFNFKWADNLQKPGDVMDFYLSGDVAPESRLMYRYAAE